MRYDTDITIENVLSEEVRNVMSSNVIYVRPTDDVGIAIDKVLTHDISGLVVMGSNNDLLGIVSRIDLVTRLSKVLGVGNLLELME
ncbi:MAG TPA: CBS domain-containing protein [Acidilobales archaeon]|nr:CBS domain-containing protein [Acidilobales archaeon]